MRDISQITSDDGQDMHILRLGYVDRANLLPLLYPLQAGWTLPESPWKLEVVHATPGALSEGLLGGGLDAALLSPVALTLNSGRLAPLRGWGLAVEGATETALLLAPERLDGMDEGHVALTPGAAGSTAEYLLKTLLQPYYDIRLNFHPQNDPAYDLKGARLLFGDGAAQEAARRPEVWVAEDLGKAWWVLTGQLMVWEMVAVGRDLETRKPGAGAALNGLLTKSKQAAQEQSATIVDEASRRLGLEKEQVKALFARQRYTLSEPEQKGLAQFLDLVARAGVLPK